ncbi:MULTISPECIES: pyridoxal phosphate-dependent aminotransferase [Hyphomonas]|uniref:histidinol-phosphate transaminase n=2 Tax=Hyphomonas adhaerens TaxID=81029 RepID=A0A069E022_9PROT|nr:MULTISPECIES: histidinol-phosphate transaminase [Hyphomonas]KCZ82609.1 classes I and II aminotransferase [Hyphomonas adhaerens MHS-3]MBB41943.1 classes I and II aminotransferase [Hyphomonas sp.]HAE28612.1 histidinol-phosphate aminotransferase family protein [Hyphomonas adhaerens]|tara:strand:- start:2889 stop:4058 length:1170 start_codon:yes stop_codon:yes gene_type:complete
MAYDISRRFLLAGATGIGVAGATACASGASAIAETTEAAFPPEKVAVENPYLLGPPEGVALLSRNENPYGPAPSALKMIEYAGSKGAYYASQVAVKQLLEMIAEKNGVAPEQIALTTGSGEALSAIAMIYGPNGPIVAPRLFWDTTALYAARLGMATIDRVPLTEGMEIDLPAIEAKVTEGTGLVQLCNPNNPTGLVSDPATLKAAVKRMAAKTTVLVDEAYMELADDPAGNTCIPLINEGHNVIVSRTFSKIYGMAGIRMGYTISSPETAQKIQATAMSWSPCTSYAAAIGCYNDEKFLNFSKGKVVEARQMITTTLDTLGLEYLPSQTNFVYFKSGKPANDVQKAFAEKKISIRGQYMDYVDWSRVSTGKIEDVERFCKALPEIVGA